MNPFFWKVWLPLHIVTAITFVAMFFGKVDVHWLPAFIAWFLIGPVGVGVGFHRLFCHRQFETWRPVEYILAILGTLSAFGPLSFWVSQHAYHHQKSDTPADPSSPGQYGFWESFSWWKLRTSTLKKVKVRHYCVMRLLRDDGMMRISDWAFPIVWIYALFLLWCGPAWFVSLFIIPTFFEHMRLNLVSSISHMKLPFSYRNFDTPDTSYNNIFLGYLFFGFGWHNNHHQDQRELVNSHRWWELDIEGLIGKLLSKRNVHSPK